jgi:peptidoglycan/xylan/chitin deacetylase (PgdA/CDA1 family)
VLFARASASSNTRVVFTVDVESNSAFELPDQVDAVCKGGVPCGLMEIVRLLKERQWSGTFFLNVYEHQRWGETAMRNIAVGLQAADQDVALHTHPQWAYDPSRWAMHQYSLDEQTDIVRDGVRLLRRWTGRPVVAHRAGAYTADENTLVALERNGVLLDSSMFWQYPASRLDGLGLPRNLPSRHGSLVEVPVTAYQRVDRPTVLGETLTPLAVVRKIDPNWFVDAAEMKAAVDAAVTSDIPIVVVFLHSFSFMAGSAGGTPLADRHAIDIFRAMLDHIATKGLRVATMRELAQPGALPLQSSASDVVPRVTVSVPVHRYVWRRLKASRTSLAAVGIGFTVLAAAVAIVWARRRIATNTRTGEGRASGGLQAPWEVRSR